VRGFDERGAEPGIAFARLAALAFAGAPMQSQGGRGGLPEWRRTMQVGWLVCQAARTRTFSFR
jgi:hypothetical protein